MSKKLLSVLLIISIQSVIADGPYRPAADFKIDYHLNAHGDSHFSDFTVNSETGNMALGAQSVLAGMDFDGDGQGEILFSIDETLGPGGPDPGHVGCYLYEIDTLTGDYNYVWSFISPDPGNSLPGMFYGDIDADSLSEIYFGVPPSGGNNDNTWGTYIFEQNEDGTFPTTQTLLLQYGFTVTDNFRPSGYAIGDVDSDGYNELVTLDRALRRMSIDEPDDEDMTSLTTFSNEYLVGESILGGGSIYNLDIVDFDDDGDMEVWVNTWNGFSMSIFEADSVEVDSYHVAADFNALFPAGDPGSFRRNGFAFHDADGDGDLDAWFPMTNGKLYYLDNVLDTVDTAGLWMGQLDSLKASHFHQVLTYAYNGRNRGSDMGDIDGDGKMDIIANTGNGETVVRMEFQGGDPKEASSYEVTTIFESKGEPGDRYYPLDISESDLDGDGKLEVVLTNLYASNPDQSSLFVLDYSPVTFPSDGSGADMPNLAPNWSVAAINQKMDIAFDDSVTTHFTNRSVIGGMDVDQDGKQEVIATSYDGARVIVYEHDAANSAFDVVWASPVPDSLWHAYNVRAVGIGDLDGDEKQEIVFSLSDKVRPGWYVYEWDGVAGSDNYGTQPSSVNQIEVDTCCTGGVGYRADQERVQIYDVDQDGQQELIISVRRGSPRGILITSVTGDIEHNSGGSLEEWSTEFWMDRSDVGGGSPYGATPADLDGDSLNEMVYHGWGNMNFAVIKADSADSYSIPHADSTDRNYYAYANDDFSLNYGYTTDIDEDGDDEVYYSSYGWGLPFGSGPGGHVNVVDYDPGDDVHKINGDHVTEIAHAVGVFIGDALDIDGKKSILVGASRPGVTALEYLGGDPSASTSYLEKVLYWGELDVTYTRTRDSTGTDMDYDYTYHSWGSATKIETNFGGTPLDLDGDGNSEILVGFQSVPDSLTSRAITWNGSAWDTVFTTVANHKPYNFILLEHAGEVTVSTDPISFIAPSDYKLSQNYPNPFNPNTTIEYSIPINRKVSVKVYNITGQLINTLIDNQMVNAGTHKVVWNGKNNLGRKVSTGMYLYSLEWAGMKKVKSMTLLK